MAKGGWKVVHGGCSGYGKRGQTSSETDRGKKKKGTTFRNDRERKRGKRSPHASRRRGPWGVRKKRKSVVQEKHWVIGRGHTRETTAQKLSCADVAP